jgi:hypothetical protein
MEHPCDNCPTRAANHKRLCWRLGPQSPGTPISYSKGLDCNVSGESEALLLAYERGALQAGRHLRLISSGQCARIRRKPSDEAWAYVWAKRESWYPKRRRRARGNNAQSYPRRAPKPGDQGQRLAGGQVVSRRNGERGVAGSPCRELVPSGRSGRKMGRGERRNSTAHPVACGLRAGA